MFQHTLDKAYAEYAVLEKRGQLPNCQFERLRLFPSACSSCNTTKNRYSNVLPAEKTRVVLEGDHDYINANLLQYHGTKFISCQAPVPSTFCDFWRMVWEKRSPLVVMLTNLVEKGVPKADSYWSEDQEWYGDILVELQETQEREGITTRTFKLLKGSQTRELVQLHFTAWPDFGVPQMDHFLSLLSQCEETIKQTPKDLEGPPIVHCSAGVGRSGVFIASLLALKELQQNRTPSVFEIVQKLREQRNGMVQTKEQYLFIYLVLNHYRLVHGNVVDNSACNTITITTDTGNSNGNSNTSTCVNNNSTPLSGFSSATRQPAFGVQRNKRKSSCGQEDSSPNKAISLSLSFSFPPIDTLNSFACHNGSLAHSDGGVY